MSQKLVWWGAEPPEWLKDAGGLALSCVPASDIGALLSAATGADLVLVDADSPAISPQQAAALLALSHVAFAAVGSATAGLRAAGLPKDRFVDGTARLKALLAADSESPAPFRFAVDGFSEREAKGRILSGRPIKGMRVALLPGGEASTLAAIADQSQAAATLLLDPHLAGASGSLLAEAGDRPEVTDQIAAHVVWVDGAKAMLPGRPYKIELAGQEATATVTALKHRLNPDTRDRIAARSLSKDQIGFCNLSFDRPICLEPAAKRTPLGAFSLFDAADGRPLARGFVEFGLRRATNVHWQALSVDRAARATLKGQQPCCLWFTGLSGSGKSTVASLLERRLHGLGRHTYVLDGDNVRHGLNRDLGFTDADRVENIRRVAEVAKLMADAGLIVMVSFISPFRAERRLARSLFKEGEFLEVFLDTPIAVCEARDPKGLYKKARAGLIKNFTGIDSPYEPPEDPELRLDAGSEAAEALVERILDDLTGRGLVSGPA